MNNKSLNKGKDNNDKVLGGTVAVFVVVMGLLWLSSSQPADVSPTVTQTTSAPKAQTVTKKSTSTAANSSDISSVTSSVAGASQFASLFSSTGVKDMLSGAGPYTVFVPSDVAINNLPKGTIANMSASQVKRLVEYHVVVGRAIDSDAVQSGSITTLSRDSLNFLARSDGTVRINSSSILKTYKANNGVVYLIDAVLLPPKTSM